MKISKNTATALCNLINKPFDSIVPQAKGKKVKILLSKRQNNDDLVTTESLVIHQNGLVELQHGWYSQNSACEHNVAMAGLLVTDYLRKKGVKFIC